MTREEAKEKLYMEWQKFLEDNIDYAGISEAYKMAFKALEQEPCEDCISRQVMQIELKKCEVIDVHDENDNLIGYYNADTVDSIVRNLSSVTPQPKMGRWILSGGYWRCSECKEKALLKLDKSKGGCREYIQIKSNVCPNCGAKMKVGE